MNVKQEAMLISVDSTLSKAKLRKMTKPLMEKRRRARINTCLNQLKNLVLEAMNQNTSHFSKLEKADILEMTVKHLCQLQRRHAESQKQLEGMDTDNFRAGYTECAQEVARCLVTADGTDSDVGIRVLKHLSKKVTFLPDTNKVSPMLYVPLPKRRTTTTATTLIPTAQQSSLLLSVISSRDNLTTTKMQVNFTGSDYTEAPLPMLALVQCPEAPPTGVTDQCLFSLTKPRTISNHDSQGSSCYLSPSLFDRGYANPFNNDTVDSGSCKFEVEHIATCSTNVWRPW